MAQSKIGRLDKSIVMPDPISLGPSMTPSLAAPRTCLAWRLRQVAQSEIGRLDKSILMPDPHFTLILGSPQCDPFYLPMHPVLLPNGMRLSGNPRS